jgi:hypothetical protein
MTLNLILNLSKHEGQDLMLFQQPANAIMDLSSRALQCAEKL